MIYSVIKKQMDQHTGWISYMLRLGHLQPWYSSCFFQYPFIWHAVVKRCWFVDGSHWLNMKILVQSLHSWLPWNNSNTFSWTSWYISETSPYYTSVTIDQEQSQNIENQSFMTDFLKRSAEIRWKRGSLSGFLDLYENIFRMLGRTT